MTHSRVTTEGLAIRKTYELRTLKDVYEQVPLEKIELCMREIAEGMVLARKLVELMNATAKAIDKDAAPQDIWPEACTWIDDGKEEKTINVTDAATGQQAFSLEVRAAQDTRVESTRQDRETP